MPCRTALSSCMNALRPKCLRRLTMESTTVPSQSAQHAPVIACVRMHACAKLICVESMHSIEIRIPLKRRSRAHVANCACAFTYRTQALWLQLAGAPQALPRPLEQSFISLIVNQKELFQHQCCRMIHRWLCCCCPAQQRAYSRCRTKVNFSNLR